MRREHMHPVLTQRSLQRKGVPTLTEELPELNGQWRDIVALQRLVGNKGVQSLLTQGRIRQHGSAISLARMQAAPSIQRCGCGGTCAACKGKEDELTVSADMGNQVQRFWGDEEEEEDSGGSWLDTATDWLTGDDDSGGDAGGGYTNPDGSTSYPDGSVSNPDGSMTNPDGSTSYSDGSVTNPDGSTSYPDGSATGPDGEPVEEGSSWWDDLWGEDSDDTDDDDSWLPDWLPDIDIPFFDNEEEEEEPVDLGEIEVEVPGDDTGQGMCMSEEASGQGSGTSGGVTVAGLTQIDWTATTGAGSFLNPSISKRSQGGKTVYDVSGKVHIDYSGADAKISFTVNPPLSQLSACKQEKVNAFKGPSGNLGKHEAQHKAAMDGFNGSEEFDHTFKGLEASSTDELTKKVNAALDALVQPKIKARQSAAQTTSDNLDPWSEPIPGIASCP